MPFYHFKLLRPARVCWLLLFFFSSGLSALERTAYLVSDTSIRSEPSPTAAVKAALSAGSQVSVMQRSGGWYEVQSFDKTGWLKFIAVRFQPGTAKGSSGLTEAAKLLTQDTGPTLTAGVKGLQKEDIEQAKPNLDAVTAMERMAVSPELARSFAAEQDLPGGAK